LSSRSSAYYVDVFFFTFCILACCPQARVFYYLHHCSRFLSLATFINVSRRAHFDSALAQPPLCRRHPRYVFICEPRHFIFLHYVLTPSVLLPLPTYTAALIHVPPPTSSPIRHPRARYCHHNTSRVHVWRCPRVQALGTSLFSSFISVILILLAPARPRIDQFGTRHT
jgi:hypothetical protein